MALVALVALEAMELFWFSLLVLKGIIEVTLRARDESRTSPPMAAVGRWYMTVANLVDKCGSPKRRSCDVKAVLFS